MPYVLKGKTVYRKNANGTLTKKGSSSSVEGAKAFMRALYAHEPKKKKGR